MAHIRLGFEECVAVGSRVILKEQGSCNHNQVQHHTNAERGLYVMLSGADKTWSKKGSNMHDTQLCASRAGEG